MLAACGQHSSESQQRLQAENDSLKLESAKNTAQMDELLSLLNEIEDDFQTIRDAENYLTIHQNDVELAGTTRDQIRRNMQLVQETLKKNKDKIAELEKKLSSSESKSAEFRKTIQRLTAELEQRAVVIANLQDELAKRDSQIRDMGQQMSTLSEEIENLALTNLSQSDRLKKQDQDLNIGYYCFGTSKELKEQKIVEGGGLLGKAKILPDGFNRDYFRSVDIREVKEIPLYARKAKLLTSHPDQSYELTADEDKNLTLFIVDYKEFWSVGKYLVIEVGL